MQGRGAYGLQKKDSGVVNLDYNSKGLIHWKQGAIERYPLIDKVNKAVKNQENMIIYYLI